MAIPKLALIPSGVKAGKLYSVLPTNGAGDFTTTRASVATRVNENGLIEEVASNVPRLDYSDGTCPSLLLEPSSTNLITYSEDFSNAAWTKARATITSNSVISPDGNLTADKLIATSVSGAHQTKETLSTVSGNYTFSVFAKKGEYKNILLWDDTLSGGVGVNLDDLSIFRDEANQGYKIEDYGNDWIRISVNYTYTAQVPQNGVYTYDNSATPQLEFAGNDVDGLYIWGAQLEQNSYATSYIKTVGTTQTRTKDKTFKTGITNLIGQSEGVLFVDFIPKGNTATQIVYQVRTSGVTNVGQIDIRFSGGTLNALGNDGGSAQFGIVGTVINLGQRYKCAIRYKKNDVAFYINGVLIGTDVVASFNSSSKDQVSFGENLTSYVPVASIKDARVYTTALSDLELTNLTTI